MDGPLGEAVRKRRGGAAAERGAEGDALREALAASGVGETGPRVTNEGESGSGNGTGWEPPRRMSGRSCRGGEGWDVRQARARCASEGSERVQVSHQ